jgi:alpha-beta hydrolase superfamily lysophospholipase
MIYFYQHWIPEHPRALVIFVHDFGDHIGRSAEFVKELTQQGHAVALFDQRGHGRSEGKRGHIGKMVDLVADLSNFVEFSMAAVPEGTPLFIVSAGTGALTVFNFLLLHTVPVAGVVALSASISPSPYINSWKTKLSERLIGLWPQFAFSREFEFEDFTDDPAQLEELENDTFFHSRITLGSLAELKRSHELIMAMPQRIYVPTLLLAGAQDPLCHPEGTRRFASRLATSDGEHHIYPGLKHDLLQCSEAPQVMRDVLCWIEARSEQRVPADKQIALNRREILWADVSPASYL